MCIRDRRRVHGESINSKTVRHMRAAIVFAILALAVVSNARLFGKPQEAPAPAPRRTNAYAIQFTVKNTVGKTVARLGGRLTDSLYIVKALLQSEHGLPITRQTLTYNGKKLSNDQKTLGDYGIQDGSVLIVSTDNTRN
eukprot:TRINITY_DN1545_c0_g1_i1.p2 TRINITY_DN1545_c0_g1~~TRINITY_DN1545_c0_g1_i1.p2  ORF type:complete len:139 (-),score=45.39 TRINITY_DN1545_c0_g1_i1:72-488(-)